MQPPVDGQCADRIRADGIDILIDLTGLTSGSRLGVFALRPAPCQITYLGYPTTTGAAYFDFRISDDVIDPPDAENRSAERLLRCPAVDVLLSPGLMPDVAPLPALGTGSVTFGSFNNLAKVSYHTLQLWHSVLAAVPDRDCS